MSKYKDDLNAIWEKYQREVSSEPVDLKTVADWAIANELWKPRPIDMSASLAKDLASTLREKKRVDSSGREYRANIPVRRKATDGTPLFEWADIDVAPRDHVEKSFQQERRSIASDCYALAMKVDHYNDYHKNEEPIQIPFDFEDDIEEMKIANGLENTA